MKKIVISLGGSVLAPTIDSHNIKKYAEAIREIAGKYRLVVVAGGGGEARRYISAARELGISEAAADDIGIMVTRLNAALLAGALGRYAYPVIPRTYAEVVEFLESGKIVIAGGMAPGQTTDAVAALIAEYLGADLIMNATSVDGIYSADPRTYPGAQKFAHLTPGALLSILSGTQLKAGSNTVLDILAAKVIERSGIPLAVVDGRDPENVRAALMEGRFSGTIVSERERSIFPL